MRPALTPPDEVERLAALRAAEILDTPPEAVFDELVRLAALVCEAPIALICLVDAERLWFKARHGLDVEETPRDSSFGAYAILAPGPFVVEDAQKDDRFRGHPLVAGEPRVRSYAGVQLANWQGHALGTLCVLDTAPRAWPAARLDQLELIGRQVVRRIEEAESRRPNTSTDRTALAVQATADGVWHWNVVTGAVQLSVQLERLLGLERHQVASAADLASLFHPTERDLVLAELEERARTGERFDIEHRLRRRDGGWLWVRSRGTCLRDPQGRPYRTTASVTDVNDRRMAADALRAERDWSQRLVASSPAAICALAPDGTTRFLNPAAERITGYSSDELGGHNWWDTFYPGPERAQVERLYRELEKGSVRDHEMTLTARDGTRRTIAWTSLERRDEKGAIAELFGFGHDVTARKDAEREMIAARESALAASHVKSQFLANMSHELRTPLNGIMGLSALLLDSPLGPEQRRHLEGVSASAETLLALVNDILDISKIEARKLELERVPFSLGATVDATMRMIAPRARAKGLELASELAPDLGDRRLGDPLRVQQILTNLVGNAVKFTERGSVRVRLARARSGEGIVGSVSDTGIGIAPEVQARLFRPFVQADGSMTRQFGGTGLGLAISHELVTLMGGTLVVESARGLGSTFTFEVPLPRAEADASPPLTASIRREPARPARPLRLLLAEDNPVNRLVATATLERLGHEVVHAEDGIVALQVLARDRFDLALVDVEMPRLDGLGLARAIRQQETLSGAHLPLVALTANAMRGDRERCLQAGMDDYATKPIRTADLEAAMGRALVRARPRTNGGNVTLAPAPSEPARAFDRASALAALDGDEGLLAAAAASFLEHAPAVETGLSKALAGSDLEQGRRLAHRLKGSLLQIGASEAASAAGAIEEASGDGGSLERARAGLERLHAEMVRTFSVLEGIGRR